MFEAAAVPNWIVLVYERYQRFNRQVADRMITGFVRSCQAVGGTFQASSTAPSHTKDSGRHHYRIPAGACEMGIGSRDYWSCEFISLLYLSMPNLCHSNSARRASSVNGIQERPQHL
jgi:hypothetical protein